MKGKKHTPGQIIRKLRDAEADLAAGLSVEEIARKLGISEATYYRWRASMFSFVVQFVSVPGKGHSL